MATNIYIADDHELVQEMLRDFINAMPDQQRSYVERALAAGAVGFVAKGNPPELITTIRTVLTGEVYLSRTLRAAQPLLQR